MAETFNYCTPLTSSGDVGQLTWENDFGDGYTQAGGIGINTKSQKWELTFNGPFGDGSTLEGVRNFLDRHEGYKAFRWTPPLGVEGWYRATGYQPRPLGAGLYSLSVTFKQVYMP
ncbi:phage tail protein [Pseudomonas protegens]|uniref:phage tail protein n=1 Tax=Pseudomonas protegens TaxID=380021 RepID=UPI0037F3AEF4